MARKTTAAKKAAPKATQKTASKAPESASTDERPEAESATESDAHLGQAARDHATPETATPGTTPYVAGAPQIKTSEVDRAIARGERSRFR